MIEMIVGGAVNAYHDGNLKFQTTSTGVSITGNILPEANNTRNIGDGSTNFNSIWASTRFRGNDDVKLVLGNSQNLVIRHDGSNNIIGSPVADDLHIKSGTGDNDSNFCAKFIHGGTVELYHNNSKKIETTSSGVTVTGGIQATGSNTAITCNTTNSNITFTSSGSNANLNHYASGSNSQIKLFSTGSNSVYKLDANGSNGLGYLDALNGVRLYHGGSFNNQKLATYQYGITVTGNVQIGTHAYWGDNGEAIFGDDTDMKIYSNNTENRVWALNGALDLRTTTSANVEILANDKYSVWGEADGMTALYHNGVRKIQTHFNGALIKAADSSACEVHVQADNGDDNNDKWKLYANTDNTFGIASYASGDAWKKGILCTGQGKTQLYYNNTSKLETSSTGIWVSGSINGEAVGLGDNKKITFGSELEIYHDGTNSFINNKVNNLRIQRNGSDHIQLEADGDVWIKGTVYPWSNNTYDLGSTSYRWRNIYTNDLNLSNKGSTNSVDNTWGDYTIQEGESDLFLINNRNGKKYKFNLTEVS